MLLTLNPLRTRQSAAVICFLDVQNDASSSVELSLSFHAKSVTLAPSGTLPCLRYRIWADALFSCSFDLELSPKNIEQVYITVLQAS